VISRCSVSTNAIFITTNEFPLFVNGFNGAQVYGIGKGAFDGHGSVVLFDNMALEEGIATACSRRALRQTASSIAGAAAPSTSPARSSSLVGSTTAWPSGR
jgi:hypothetical protein